MENHFREHMALTKVVLISVFDNLQNLFPLITYNIKGNKEKIILFCK